MPYNACTGGGNCANDGAIADQGRSGGVDAQLRGVRSDGEGRMIGPPWRSNGR